MLIYEKNNKLNINFDNEISENPDLQIGKEDGKTEVLVDGQPSGGGGGSLLVTFENATTTLNEPYYRSATTYKQAMDAFKEGRQVVFYFPKNSTYVGTASDVWFSMAGIDFSNPGDGETYPMIILSRLDQGGSAISQSSGQINDIDAPIEWSFYFD